MFYTFLGTPHLLFDNPELDIQCLVKLHKSIDVVVNLLKAFSIRANPSCISFIIVIIVVSFAWSDLMPRSTAVRRDSIVFLAGRRAMDHISTRQGVNVSRPQQVRNRKSDIRRRMLATE